MAFSQQLQTVLGRPGPAGPSIYFSFAIDTAASRITTMLFEGGIPTADRTSYRKVILVTNSGVFCAQQVVVPLTHNVERNSCLSQLAMVHIAIACEVCRRLQLWRRMKSMIGLTSMSRVMSALAKAYRRGGTNDISVWGLGEFGRHA